MHKTITYDHGDYRMELDGECVGYAPTYHAAEVRLDEMVYEMLTHTNACSGFGCVDGCGDCQAALEAEGVTSGQWMAKAA